MTAATLAPPIAASGNAPNTPTRDPEILPRRTPSVRSTTHEPSNDASLQRHSSTRSQTSALEKRKQQQDTTSASRRPSERRKVIRIGNYVINRKTIGAGSMGKVKLATCLTDSDRQQVHTAFIMRTLSIDPCIISTVCSQGNAQDQSSRFSRCRYKQSQRSQGYTPGA